jgi:TatA/E family protein of Tat protein translocase
MAFAGMEWVIVGIVVILLFFGGAKKIPEFAQNLGRARGEYERGRLEVEKQMVGDRAAVAAGTTGAPSAHTRYCSKCGTPAPGPDAAFCAKCGSHLPTHAA